MKYLAFAIPIVSTIIFYLLAGMWYALFFVCGLAIGASCVIASQQGRK
jgi:hypothetical protein